MCVGWRHVRWCGLREILLILIVVSLILFASSLILLKNLLLNVLSLHSAFLLSSLYVYYDPDLKKLMEKLTLLKSSVLESLLYGAGALLLMLLVYLIGLILLRFIGFDDSAVVSSFIQSMPLEVLIIAVFIAPITEELFFRRLMLDKFGLLLSSLLFTLFHISYGSIVELAGALTLAVILGLLAERKGVAPCIVAHMLYNLSSVIAVKVLFQ